VRSCINCFEQRIDDHLTRAARWKREGERTPDQQTEEEPLLPSEMCANECERHEWHAEALAFIRDHVDPSEVYRLGEADLAFGELLPAKPGWLEQDEWEERNRVGFELERLTKAAGGLVPAFYRFASAHRDPSDVSGE
jgi:hypothetical protein